MEIFMRRVPPQLTATELTLALADVFHNPPYSNHHQSAKGDKINFHVVLFPPKNRDGHQAIHSGVGALTLPTEEIAYQFLDDEGDLPPICRGIKFSPSERDPREETLQRVRLLPYEDPRIQEAHRRRKSILDQENVPIDAVQFCWRCRDETLSVEWQERCPGRSRLWFEYDHRELHIEIDLEEDDGEGSEDSLDGYDTMFEDEWDEPERRVPACIITIPFATVDYVTAHLDSNQTPAIFLDLTATPKYELLQPRQTTRTKLSSLPFPGHDTIAPYVTSIRLTCGSPFFLEKFRELAETASFQEVSYEVLEVNARGLFSSCKLHKFDACMRRFCWRVAFQLHGLLCSGLVHPQELFDVLPTLWEIHEKKGKVYTEQVARQFADLVKEAKRDLDLTDILEGAKRYVEEDPVGESVPSEGSLYYAYHVTITPTSMELEGPELDQSNRVIRKYHPDNHDCFLRVNFVDEMGLHYRFNREVAGPAFIRERVGTILKKGLHIAGRKFDFLAYSQSALKDHSVWFVKPFNDPKHGEVDAKKIIESIGDFTGPLTDKSLVYCPARYAARLSQAFTATDAVNVAVDEILLEPDITTKTATGKTYEFTDGVGTMSEELARAIWSSLKTSKKVGKGRIPHPKAYQIRFRGSKGMLSVDYKLKGRVMTLRPSMVKFDTPEDDMTIEIARVFDRPNNYVLNRPLIMLMEGLGVPYETFKKYQDRAVKVAQDSTRSLRAAAQLMESHGLGAAYGIPSILNKLSRAPFNMESLPRDTFYGKMLTHAMNHALRVLKTKAAIPVPGAWTLVGVADVHGQLYPGEIFAHIRTLDGKNIYLEGPVLISRSPTIHPGDVTMVHAIGPPPKGSCFEAESLRNTVVFSTKGSRPTPSCLGGGDLDGDTYNLIPLNDLPEFRPKGVVAPADYPPAPKKMLDRPSTMEDVADFVVEFIYSDLVGIVASNWMIIADQSEHNIFDPDCIELARIHSNAVDYPKSGVPVDNQDIPRLKHSTKPDWNAPETVNVRKLATFYESKSAIGRLFRSIKLPAEELRPTRSYTKRAQAVQELLENTTTFSSERSRDYLYCAVEGVVSRYMDTSGPFNDEVMNEIAWFFKRYTFELHSICSTTTLSRQRKHELTEEEAVVGTMSEKSAQPRRRIELISKLKDKTTRLVQGKKEAIAGDDSINMDEQLVRSWIAFQVAKSNQTEFGAQSFSWMALGNILDAIEDIEQDES